jgi:serine protease Do
MVRPLSPAHGRRVFGEVTIVTLRNRIPGPMGRVLGAVPAVLLVLAWSGVAHGRAAPESFADLVDTLLPTVVNISTTQEVERGGGSEEFEEFFREFFERRGEERPQRRRQSSLGSGFIIDPSGYIVTNHHVIAEADQITVRLADESELEATLVGSDEKTDLALLKVESDHPLPFAKWGDSEATRIGDWVIAIGNPFGLGGTVTAGIVSARQRDINSGPYDNFIQTDAAINRGNSGGPMFNVDGEVIGINSAIFSPSGGSVGIGFAIPSALARNIIAQLEEGGEVQRGWLGVRIQTVTDELAEGLRLDRARGALVASVSEGGPAEAAGIKQGDVILIFDGREVTAARCPRCAVCRAWWRKRRSARTSTSWSGARARRSRSRSIWANSRTRRRWPRSHRMRPWAIRAKWSPSGSSWPRSRPSCASASSSMSPPKGW